MVKERIEKLQKLMQHNGIDIYIISTADFHMSEYIGEYFKTRKYMSGFTGSAGTLVVSLDRAVLYTDGRYFIQAKNEIKDSNITLMKMGEKNVPSIEEYIEAFLVEKGRLAFDGRMISAEFGEKIKKIVDKKSGRMIADKDLVAEIWTDRPSIEFKELYYLEEKYTGKSMRKKLEDIRRMMREEGAKTFVLTSLDDIAWLFNLRGNDIPDNPVFLSYVVITMTDVTLYTGAEVPKEALDAGIKTRDYFEIYNDLKDIKGNVILDKSKVNYKIVNDIKKGHIIDVINPTTLLKAIKNETEILNLKKCHIKDAVAMTKFMYWLKNNVGKTEITEMSAAQYLEELRKKQEGYVQPSFETISAYKKNAAMMHYSATENSNAVIEKEGMLLVDSGGQYYEGTTDVTRTFVLGEITDEMRLHFTTVTKSMLRLANTKFLYGCTGLNLDIVARGPLWNLGIDYKCGTGHGVGYMLNVHEGPNGFRWKKVPERQDGCILEEGMVTTDEPGVYIEGSHGIRIENELVCKCVMENEYGKFMGFETITFVPIDLDGIDKKYLDKSDIQMLNEYHRRVFKVVSPYLNDEEIKWFEDYIRDL